MEIADGAGALSPELFWLAALSLLTATLWVPHILSLIADNGLITALADGQHDILDPEAEVRLKSAWAERAKRAHANAVENLVAFAPIVLILHLTGQGDATTATLCAAFFWLRVGHFVVYALGLPFIRTLLFAAGYFCLLALAYALFT